MKRSRALSRAESAVVAVGLLAVAFPAAVPPVLGTVAAVVGLVFAVVGWALAHLSLCCAAAAAVLLVRAFPRTHRRAGRWLAMSTTAAVNAVRPRAV